MQLPLVKLEINEKEYNSRNRRSVHSDLPLACNPEDNERRCCRYPFVLDFDELGPDFKFIISPKRYWANYCKGVCPDYVLPSSPNIQLTRGVHRSQRCCTPSSVDSLTLIYVNENQDIMRGVIPGMSISSCGCEWDAIGPTILRLDVLGSNLERSQLSVLPLLQWKIMNLLDRLIQVQVFMPSALQEWPSKKFSSPRSSLLARVFQSLFIICCNMQSYG